VETTRKDEATAAIRAGVAESDANVSICALPDHPYWARAWSD
jgi:hypothetical protein